VSIDNPLKFGDSPLPCEHWEFRHKINTTRKTPTAGKPACDTGSDQLGGARTDEDPNEFSA
jgi:hypothetical protein